MGEFRRGMAELGRSMPVYIETTESELIVTATHLDRLCQEYLDGHLDEVELEYVASALELCPDFRCVSSAIEDAVFYLANPVANGSITPESVREIVQMLSP